MLKFLVLLVFGCNFGALQKIPTTFPACPRYSPDLSDCLVDTLNSVRGRFVDGKLASDWTIDPLDPFFLKEFEVIDTPVFKFVVYDILMSGATNFNLKKIDAEVNGNFLRVQDRVEIPVVNMKTKYKISGPLPIPLTGELNFSLLDFMVHGDTRVRLYKRDNVEYAEIVSVKLVIDSTKLDNVSFSLPLGRVRELGFFSKTFLRIFGERMTKIAYRILESKVDKLHIDTVNRFLMDTPADHFLPEK